MTTTIVVSATQMKKIIAQAEQNAANNPELSPNLEITLTAKRQDYTETDKVQVNQLPYSFNADKVEIR